MLIAVTQQNMCCAFLFEPVLSTGSPSHRRWQLRRREAGLRKAHTMLQYNKEQTDCNVTEKSASISLDDTTAPFALHVTVLCRLRIPVHSPRLALIIGLLPLPALPHSYEFLINIYT